MHTVRSLADYVGGKVVGDGADVRITGINDLRAARPDQISFLGKAKYEQLAHASKAGAILVTPKDSPKFSFTRIEVESPSNAFGKIVALFAPPPPRDEPGIHPTAVIAPDAVIGEGASIGPQVVISAGVRIGARAVIGANCFIGEQTTIGDDVRLYPLVMIRERCVLGSRVIIHSGGIVGGDGFGYEFHPKTKRHVKIPHTGYVQIDDDVEIGANSTIDRGRFDWTHIAKGAKIDNLVMVAHNATIGPDCILVAQVGVSGSTKLGQYVTLAGQVGVAGHLTVGDKAIVTGQSFITKDAPGGMILSGVHVQPWREFHKKEAYMRRLPELFERLKALKAKVKSLEEKKHEHPAKS